MEDDSRGKQATTQHFLLAVLPAVSSLHQETRRGFSVCVIMKLMAVEQL